MTVRPRKTIVRLCVGFVACVMAVLLFVAAWMLGHALMNRPQAAPSVESSSQVQSLELDLSSSHSVDQVLRAGGSDLLMGRVGDVQTLSVYLPASREFTTSAGSITFQRNSNQVTNVTIVSAPMSVAEIRSALARMAAKSTFVDASGNPIGVARLDSLSSSVSMGSISLGTDQATPLLHIRITPGYTARNAWCMVFEITWL